MTNLLMITTAIDYDRLGNVITGFVVAMILTFFVLMIRAARRDYEESHRIINESDEDEDDSDTLEVVNWKGSTVRIGVGAEEQHLMETTPWHFANRFIISKETVRRGGKALIEYQRLCIMREVPADGLGTKRLIMLGSFVMDPEEGVRLRNILDYHFASEVERNLILNTHPTGAGGGGGTSVVSVRGAGD